jgi:copper transport protein
MRRAEAGRPASRTEPLIRAALAALIAALGLGILAPRATAHATVERTDPAIDEVVGSSPPYVSIWFNEPVEISFGGVRVFDTSGRRVDAGQPERVDGDAASVRVALNPGLPDGTYTVAWRVISADGHPIQEAFVFHVGAPGPNPRGIGERVLGQTGSRTTGVLYGIARWLTFAALLVLVGGGVFLVWVWAYRWDGIAHGPEVEDRFARRWRVITLTAWSGAVVGTASSFVFQTAVAADVSVVSALDRSLVGELATSRFGIVTLVRLVLLAALAVPWVAMRRRATAERAFGWYPDTKTIWLAAALGVGALLTASLAGHAGATDPVPLNVVADAAHLVAGAAWVGGLVMMLGAAFPATTALTGGGRVRELAPVVSRFSDLAVVSVGVLVASGLVRSWIEIGALSALTGTTYGLVLLTKVGAFLPMVALGAVNNRWAKPRLQRAAEEGSATDGEGALRTLRRSIVVEVALAALVLGVTAFLVNIAPARVAAGLEGPFITDVRIGSDNLNVIVDPNQVGENEVHLTVTEPNGSPTVVRAMRVLFRMPEDGIGPLVGEGTRLAPGHFVVQGRQLSVAGDWTLEIVARLGRFDEERTTVEVTVHEREESSCGNSHHC